MPEIMEGLNAMFKERVDAIKVFKRQSPAPIECPIN